MTCPACQQSPVGRCRSCAQLTPEARARNRQNGIRGGRASGIARARERPSAEYLRGYNSGWQAGVRTGWRQALGEES